MYVFGGVPASLLAPVVAARLRTQSSLTTLTALGMAAGLTGLLVAPEAALLWVARPRAVAGRIARDRADDHHPACARP